jgi:GH25 family lysozyme M1 (1,4-beta-N-acetylmuramidase)
MSWDYKGIDVSEHNPTVNMTKVKDSGINFVMIRAGYGKYKSQKDKCFETHYKNASAAGLCIGAYWYSYATTVADAELEAKLFLEIIKGKKFNMPVAFDIEDECQVGLNKDIIGKIITTFCNILEKAGYFAMLYSYDDFLTQKVSAQILKRYALWCANTVGSPTMECGIHQYSFKGNIPGVYGDVDLNKACIDYPSVIMKQGLNGYPKSSNKAPVKATLDSTGYKYKDSDNGVLALKKLLMLAKQKKIITATVDNTPSFGSGTQKAVNEFLNKLGYVENGIAGSNFITALFTVIINTK